MYDQLVKKGEKSREEERTLEAADFICYKVRVRLSFTNIESVNH
jgi:hypothetical protein